MTTPTTRTELPTSLTSTKADTPSPSLSMSNIPTTIPAAHDSVSPDPTLQPAHHSTHFSTTDKQSAATHIQAAFRGHLEREHHPLASHTHIHGYAHSTGHDIGPKTAHTTAEMGVAE
ncbi:hypothetical protein HK097_000110, partial [Rhizophlyctis rosea]